MQDMLFFAPSLFLMVLFNFMMKKKHFLLAKNKEWKSILIKELTLSLGLKKEEIHDFKDTALLEIGSHHSLNEAQLAFSLATLPECELIQPGTIAQQAKQVFDLTKNQIEQSFCLHIFSVSEKYGVITSARAELLRGKLLKVNKASDSRKSFFGIYKSSLKQPLLQVLILPDRSLAVSLVLTKDLPAFQAILPSHPGGFLTIKEDKIAPSRAYRKIKEAQIIMDRYFEKEQTVVDLGACPGGWTYIALQRDAKVIAIDRSELAPELMDNPNVEFIKADAFKFVTDTPVDWVISDIICAPKRIQELMKIWLGPKKAAHFVFTLKFQGESDYEIVQEFKVLMKSYPDYTSLLRQLNTNKNEVTLMGFLS